MISNQETLHFSPYMAIFAMVVPKDNMLRQINKLVDFSFVLEELKHKYCLENGCNAVPPIRMFKYYYSNPSLIIQISMSWNAPKNDMSFKYFLDMAPEYSMIDPS